MSDFYIAKKHRLSHIFTFFILSTCTYPAYAYLDPGSGSLIIQGIIGAIAAVGVTMKLYWHKIKLKFSGKKPSKPEDDSTDDNMSEK